jgi:hypothetical protein
MKSVVQSLLSQFNESHPKLNALKLGKFVDIFRSTIEKNKISKPSNKTEIIDSGLIIEDISVDDARTYLQGQRPWRAKSKGRPVAVAAFDGTNPLMLVNLRNAIDDSSRYDKESKCIVGYDLTSLPQEKIDAVSTAISNFWGNGSFNNKSDFNGEIRSSKTLAIVLYNLEKSTPGLNVKVIYQDDTERFQLQRDRAGARPKDGDSLSTRLSKFKNTKLIPQENKFKKGQEKDLIARCMNLEANGSRFREEIGIEYDGSTYVLEYMNTYGSNNLLKLATKAEDGNLKVFLSNKGYAIATTGEKPLVLTANFNVTIDDSVSVKGRYE